MVQYLPFSENCQTCCQISWQHQSLLSLFGWGKMFFWLWMFVAFAIYTCCVRFSRKAKKRTQGVRNPTHQRVLLFPAHIHRAQLNIYNNENCSESHCSPAWVLHFFPPPFPGSAPVPKDATLEITCIHNGKGNIHEPKSDGVWLSH